MKRRKIESIIVVVLAVMMIAGLLGLLQEDAVSVEAAESRTEAQVGASWPLLVTSSVISADTTYTAKQWAWAGYDATVAEVWYDIDQGTTNTMTLYLDASPDNSMWQTGYATVVSANVADATSHVTATIRGRYFRIRADVTNTNNVTPTIKVILR